MDAETRGGMTLIEKQNMDAVLLCERTQLPWLCYPNSQNTHGQNLMATPPSHVKG